MLASEHQSVGEGAGNGIGGRPACPNCGRPMHLTRSMPRAAGAPDLPTYKCGECGVWASKAATVRV